MKSISSLFVATALVCAANAYAQTNLWQNSGNIGVGTTNPQAPLHVYGYGNGNLGTIRLDSPNSWTSITSRQFDILGEPEGYTVIDNVYSATDNSIVIGGGLNEFNTATSISFYTGTAVATRTGTARMTIDRNGRIGIGTETPLSDLQVGDLSGGNVKINRNGGWNEFWVNEPYPRITLSRDGPASGVAGLQFGIGVIPADTTIQRLPGYPGIAIMGGNVGIGTTNPTGTLTVVSTPPAGYANIEFGAPSTVSGQQSASLTFLGWGIEHAGVSWVPNTATASSRLSFSMGGSENPAVNMPMVSILGSGNVGIGTTSPTEKLSVNGKIRAQEVIVETTGWSDHVFADSYKLASLSEVEQHIKAEKHLPGVPSAQEVAEKGVSVGDMQAILLAKIEELTLHVIQQEKRLSAQDAKMEAQTAKISALESENARLTAAIE